MGVLLYVATTLLPDPSAHCHFFPIALEFSFSPLLGTLSMALHFQMTSVFRGTRDVLE